jgi:hypothetical protein
MIEPYRTPERVVGKLAASLIKCLGRPEEVALSVVFLASDAGSLYIEQISHGTPVELCCDSNPHFDVLEIHE